MTTVDHLAASETRITPKKTKTEVHHLATKWKSFLLNIVRVPLKLYRSEPQKGLGQLLPYAKPTNDEIHKTAEGV